MGKKIFYISGEGHSGSTLLDILLGSQKDAFSTGELHNLPVKGIQNGEFCSCGQPIPNCGVWMNVIEKWNQKRILDLDKYIQVQKELISNKNIISSFKKLQNPTDDITSYLKDKQSLYNIIFEQTNSNVIVDSSKSPHNILMLQHMDFDITIIHLVRRFGDVLNSYKKSYKKDLAAGIEEDIKPSKTYYILLLWLLNNFLSMIYSRGMKYKKIRYEEIVRNPINYIANLVDHNTEYIQLLDNRGPFKPNHLAAGNRIRMNSKIFIAKKPMDSSYHRLNTADKLLARSIDFFY